MAGVPFGVVVVLLALVLAEIVELDVTVDHQPSGHISQPRHAQPEVPLGVGDRQLFASLLLLIFGDVFAREGMALLAAEGAKQLKGSSPPGALAVCTALVGLWRRHVQDARQFVHVIVAHRARVPPWNACTIRRDTN